MSLFIKIPKINQFVSLAILIFALPTECYWKFPGMLPHSTDGKKEQDAFYETMKALLQPGDACNVQENEDALKDLNSFIKQTADVDVVKKEFLKWKGKLCRYDLSVCDPDKKMCECNGNANFDASTKTCRVRIGWPCTEEGTTEQCVKNAACKPWEGSFSYDTETFPTASDFFSDANKYFCRCSDDDDSECGGAGDDTRKADKDLATQLAVNCAFLFSSVVVVILWARMLTNQRF